jgi:U4/U6 small nuclear ribonucleoprotein PRP4
MADTDIKTIKYESNNNFLISSNQNSPKLNQMQKSLGLSESSLNTITERQLLEYQISTDDKLRQIDRKAPQDDQSVKNMLQTLNEPISHEMEDAWTRRERLKRVLLVKPMPTVHIDPMDEESEEDEVFYTEAPKSLIQVRNDIMDYSISMAKTRLSKQKILFDKSLEATFNDNEDEIKKNDMIEKLSKFTSCGSQIGDTRPINSIALALHGENEVLTGSWAGQIKSWSLPKCQQVTIYKGHQDMISGIAMNPIQNKIYFASGSADHTCKLWTKGEGKPVVSLSGHTNRLGRIAFHPSGRFIATPSYDLTWRFWDLETNQCLYEQEGHSKEVYCCAFHPDGSLITTCDLGGIARIWDLRTGKTVIPFTGHAKQILTTDWNPNGFELATGSDDNTIRIWDLRKKKCMSVIPAHMKLISSVKYESNGRFFVSASYDKTIKIWTNLEFKCVKTLNGHEDKVMSCDVSQDAETLVSSSWDKTWKVWSKQDDDLLDLNF